jgi:putative membrane protein
MRRGAVRWTLAVLLVILAAAFPATGIAFAVQNGQNDQPAGAGMIDSRDREFLTMIRFANLWEIPRSKLALERGTTQPVKDAATTMLADHTKLNTVVAGLADEFGITLPARPKSSQQAWMAEITAERGQDFDRTFVNRFRAAHGSVFQLIAEVRAGTRNPTILDFATQANTIVMKHMTLLERTGYVTAGSGHFAEASARTTAYPENTLSTSDIFVGGLIFVLVGGGTMFTVRVFSSGATR